MKLLAKENKVDIIGTIETLELTPGVSQAGANYVRGRITVKVSTPSKEMRVPVDFYCGERTTKGEPRKLYTQLNSLKQGQRVSLVGNIGDNKFWDQTRGQLVKTQRLNLNFINDVQANAVDKAEFAFSGFVKESLREVFNKEGEAIGMAIKLAQVTYQETRAQVIEFKVNPLDREAVNHITNSYTNGKTVKIYGVLDYDVITETFEEKQDFGKPQIKTYQRNIANLVITSGASVNDGIYEPEDITTLLDGDSKDDKEVEAKAKTQEKSGAATTGANKPLGYNSNTNQSLL